MMCGVHTMLVVCLFLTMSSWGAPLLLPLDGPPSRMMAGEPVDLRVQIQWEGAPDAYAIFAATAESIDWATAEVIQTAAETTNNTQRITQTLRITPLKTGDRSFPAIGVTYAAKEQLASAKQPSDAETQNYPKLTSEPFPVTVREPMKAGPRWLIGGAAAGIAGAIVAILIFRRRSRRTEPAAASPAGKAQDSLHQARRQRLDGDLYGYYQALASAVKVIDGNDETGALLAALHERARQVGYQGMRPADDQLDGDLRDVERALRRFKEATEQ